MTRPDFIISREQYTNGGSIQTLHLYQIFLKLNSQGVVVLPIDTCYAPGAFAAYDTTFTNITLVLNRKPEPLSLSCATYSETRSWIAPNAAVFAVLEHLTPGPITVVCRASERLREHPTFFEKVIASKDKTIGMRLPDSIVEREIAGTSEQYLLTTAAIRDPFTSAPIREFGAALDIIANGVERSGGAGWGAVEGIVFYSRHSTVVRVFDDRSVKMIRGGEIPFEKIEQAARMLPVCFTEDWT